MDANIPAIESVLSCAGRWPVLVSIVVAGAAGWIITLMVERYLLEVATTDRARRRQKFGTFLLNCGLSALLTTIMWDALVADVSLLTRLEVSAVAAVVTAFLYPVLAALATKRWPSIGSAWSPPA